MMDRVNLRTPRISRRDATRTLLMMLGGAALVRCGGTTDAGGTTSSGGASSGATSSGGTSTTEAGSAEAWASGGTQAMTAKASYPDPFLTPSTQCVLATAATEGPCTEAADRERQDISEGFSGLPVRLALRAVDASCNPIAGARIKVWHTQRTGSYSGDTPNSGMCLEDAAQAAKHYFRGVQTTDANGRVDFDTCLPGWYRGRTIHIHFTVSLGGKDFTSQLVFDDALMTEIFTSHGEYSEFGTPDTTNATDNIVSNGDLARYTLTTARMSDGAMLASKELVVALG